MSFYQNRIIVWVHIRIRELATRAVRMIDFFGILFLTNTIDSSIITMKSVRITNDGNSGTAGVAVEIGVAVGFVINVSPKTDF